MIGETYNAGDTVIVRQWDDMEEEFGLSGSRSIAVRYSFTPEMAEFCGEELTITRAYHENDKYYVAENTYTWSSGMFESPNEGEDADVAGFYGEGLQLE